ncbi:TIGR02391 family protein [Promethearchaeum syntrophicum]|uniref:TIGR02391 family protein n=1 Tax=Promethearchaeum syntrophicum TaxID=2594042 RepID=A0A5B9DEJ7_9ARCH
MKLQKSFKNKKLFIIQFSTTDIFQKPSIATHFFALDYFKDTEVSIEYTSNNFFYQIEKFFKKHKKYHFAFWNYNHIYKISLLIPGISLTEKKVIERNIIDLDDAFEFFSEEKKTRYLKRQNQSIDKRYYFSLLNGYNIDESFWKTGIVEKDLRDAIILSNSCRLKCKVMSFLITKMKDGRVKFDHNEEFMRKTIKFMELQKISSDQSTNTINFYNNIWNLINRDIRIKCQTKFHDGYFADSVEAAFKEINTRVKTYYHDLKGEWGDGASLMRNAFSGIDPVISWLDQKDPSSSNIQKGFEHIFAGAMIGIRNPKAHANLIITKDRAIHFLFLASLLMDKIDEANIKTTS